ncbi:MAG: ABC transporter [Sphingobacteriia bacterium]|nr:ABC transporter [Sphingobacteriia bacterium]NCC38491.1 ABC transporter [Gammaproteobacteria bacterium]
MSVPDLLLDPLFRLPLMTGTVIALVLPLIGALLMLRDEWLAALGLAHLAAASALVGLAVGLPAVLGGMLGALAAGVVKSLSRASGNLAYGFMILLGWSALVLIAANTTLGAALGHALIDGQLYFSGALELTAALLLGALTALTLIRIMPHLMRARFFPTYEQANRLPARRWHLTFDLLVALGLAIATATVGLMGAFSLVLVPAWIAFHIASSWTWTLVISALVGILSMMLAYLAALAWDQPFGPILVGVLLSTAAMVVLARQLRMRFAGGPRRRLD